MDENNEEKSSFFSFLPEGCITNILSFSSPSPKDLCRASVVSMGFKFASESDTIWENFLPSDYKDIISKSVSPPLNYETKKELYFHLCHSPILMNDGTLSFWLSKSTGKHCYMLCSRELSIIWSDDPRYWRWTSIPTSRFSEVAELLDVCWLNIRGKIQTQMLSLKTTYAAYLVFKITENSYGLETVAKASVGFASTSTSDLIEPESYSVYLETPTHVHEIDGQVRHQRNDGWLEIFLGEFFNNEGDGEINVQVSETTVLNWKRGLILEGIELRPKEDA